MQIATRAFLGIQLIALGVAAGTRTLFLSEFGLSLGQVGETANDWIQRLILVPFNAAGLFVIFLLLTLPVPLWCVARDIAEGKFPPEKELESPDRQSPSFVADEPLGAREKRCFAMLGGMRNRPKPFCLSRGIALLGPTTLILLVAIALTDFDDIVEGFELAVIGLIASGLFGALWTILRATDQGGILRKAREQVSDYRQLSNLAVETVGPLAPILLLPIPLFGLAPGGQVTLFPIDQTNVLSWALSVLLVSLIVFRFLLFTYSKARREVVSRDEKPGGLPRTFISVAGLVALLVIVAFGYQQLYTATARQALESGRELPATGLASILHDGISIYELDIDDSIEIPDSAPHFAATLAETDAEFGILLLEPNEFFNPTRMHPSVNRRACNPGYGPECFDIGDFVWVPRDKVNLRYRLNP